MIWLYIETFSSFLFPHISTQYFAFCIRSIEIKSCWMFGNITRSYNKYIYIYIHWIHKSQHNKHLLVFVRKLGLDIWFLLQSSEFFKTSFVDIFRNTHFLRVTERSPPEALRKGWSQSARCQRNLKMNLMTMWWNSYYSKFGSEI